MPKDWVGDCLRQNVDYTHTGNIRSQQLKLVIPIQIIFCVSLSVGCKPVRKRVFEWSGVTLDFSAATMSLKELHLVGVDNRESSVLISGKVIHLGDAGTFVVMEEGGSQILVDVTSSDQILASEYFGKKLQVYGRLEGGRNGLPLVVATGVRELR